MTALNRTTLRRLKKLRQIPSVWEGDRRLIQPGFMGSTEPVGDTRGECILWVDGSEGLVRAMDLVPPNVGHEAVVRTLLRAMEYPHSSVSPARPTKIVVRDREIQFFLRGVLQDLNITVDYEPSLPLIDEIFRSLQEATSNRPPQLPPEQAQLLLDIAQEIWEDAPWVELDEEKIISVDLNYGDVGTLYISILGMLGMEYGILMYRSVESLKQFRQRVLQADDSPEGLEQAFLEQDCFFVTFDQTDNLLDAEEEDAFSEDELLEVNITPSFGNLHPLEGMRPVLYEEEAIAVSIALTALHRFFKQHLRSLSVDVFPAISSTYRIPDPKAEKKKVSVKVSTMPDLAIELFEMSGSEEEDTDPFDFGLTSLPVLRNDLVPTDAFYSLGALSWDILDFLRTSVKFYQKADADFPTKSDGFPVILIQATRPKALALIEGLQASGGLKAICFNPGEDPFANQRYDLGILQANNGDLHLFGEFSEDDPVHIQARKKWDQRCKKTQGYCGLIVAKGFKGATRANPDFKDMLALFEVRSLSAKDLGLGPLELVPHLELP
jgi:hypothetical protein